ncbi:hypothetical protein NL676_028577 [Syzygium grande]|nr:hypothetical protein NL676_028577 [Syzygium grande]
MAPPKCAFDQLRAKSEGEREDFYREGSLPVDIPRLASVSCVAAAAYGSTRAATRYRRLKRRIDGKTFDDFKLREDAIIVIIFPLVPLSFFSGLLSGWLGDILKFLKNVSLVGAILEITGAEVGPSGLLYTFGLREQLCKELLLLFIERSFLSRCSEDCFLSGSNSSSFD